MAPTLVFTLNIPLLPLGIKAHCALGTFCPVGCYRNARAAGGPAGVKHLWTCRGWNLSLGRKPFEAGFARQFLPSWAITALSMRQILPGSTPNLSHLMSAIRLTSG